MPLQYKIEYRWNDKVADFKKAKARSGGSSSGNSRRSQTGGKAAQENAHGGRGANAERKSGGGGGSKTSGGGSVGKESSSGGKSSAAGVPGLEKVILPAGYCVYYARGRGAPLLQIDDSHQGRILRSNNKGLGVVNPDSHHVVEEEYAIIREVMEVYLEKQVSEGEAGARYRPGGQLEQQKRLLEELMLSLPGDTEGPTQTVPDAIIPVHSDDQLPTQSDALTKSMDTSRSLPTTGRVTSRCLLPISKALRTDASPRGPFLMEGQSVLDGAGKDGGSKHQPQDKQPEADSEQVLDLDSQEHHVQDSSGVITPDPPEDSFEVQSQHEDKPKVDLLVTDFKALTPQIIRVKQQKGQQPEMKYGLIHTVNSQGPKSPRFKLFKRKGFLTSRPTMRTVIPHKQEALLVVSERSLLEDRKKDTARDTSRRSQKIAAQSAREILFGSEKPVTTLFKETGKSRTRGGTLQHWNPVASHMPQIRSNWQTVKMEEVDGHSFVTQRRSKLVLDVVLPRENKSREETPHLKNATGTLYRPQQPQDWISATSSPPPPPPPSAPTNAEGDDLGELYVLNHDSAEGDDDDDDGEEPCSCSASSYSAASFSSSHAAAEESRFLDEAERSTSAARAVCSENGSSSQPAHHPAPSDLSGLQAAPSVPSPTVLREVQPPDSKHNQRTVLPQSPVRRTSQDSAKRSTHSATSRGESIQALCRQQSGGGDSHHRTPSPCPEAKALHCDVLGSGLCGDCVAAQHRRHFTAQQEILYPNINATPRHMVAAHKIKAGRQPPPPPRSKEDVSPHGQGLTGSGAANWSYMPPEGQLNNVVTDLELCRRIVEKGHRARLPSSFS